MSKFYITTPIYYVNAEPHLGGAYTTIAADVLARWHRIKGERTFFLTGTDEHGEKVAETAEEMKMSPKRLCDQNAARYEKTWDVLKISYDRFIRTTESTHEKVVSKVLEELKNRKLIYQGQYQGLYCVGCERYYTPKELIDGRCPLHQTKAIKLSEKCYFFRLSFWQKKLIELIKKNKWVIEPKERRNEVLGFLTKEKLEDLSISREKVGWGIPVPWDKTQTIYVWIDALLNYLSGIGWNGDVKKWPKNWPPEIQLIGKDILRFHAIIWPGLLLSLGAPLPKKLFAHGFFTVNGQKMSKSLGNILNPEELAIIFGADALRWLILSAISFGQDGDVSQSKFYDKYNTDLSNGLGNLTRRVLVLALKNKGKFSPPRRVETEFREKIKHCWQNYEKNFDDLKLDVAISNINNLISFFNKYVDKKAPWLLFKNNPAEYKIILYNLLEGLRHLSWMIQPFMPDKSDLIFDCLGLLRQEKKRNLVKGKQWGKTEFKGIKTGEILFPKL